MKNPVLKGFIFDIKKFAIHDGPGLRTTIFFKGCPLDCRWCHNPESRQPGVQQMPSQQVRRCTPLTTQEDSRLIGKEVSVREVMKEIEKDVIFYDESGGGVTFSGGEPLLQPEFLRNLLLACREKELHTIIDTSGYIPWASLEAIREYADLFYYDIKLIDTELHKIFAGTSNHIILSNLEKLLELGHKVVVRVALIPGITDTVENITGIRNYIAKLKGIGGISILPYNPVGEDKYRRFDMPVRIKGLKRQSSDQLKKIKSEFELSNLPVNIEGGAHE